MSYPRPPSYEDPARRWLPGSQEVWVLTRTPLSWHPDLPTSSLQNCEEINFCLSLQYIVKAAQAKAVSTDLSLHLRVLAGLRKEAILVCEDAPLGAAQPGPKLSLLHPRSPARSRKSAANTGCREDRVCLALDLGLCLALPHFSLLQACL